MISFDVLNCSEEDNEDGEQCEEKYQSPTRPRMNGSTPLEGKNQTDHGGKEADGAQGIETTELLAECEICIFRLREFENDKYDGKGNCPQWYIDVETPTPTYFVGEDTAK